MLYMILKITYQTRPKPITRLLPLTSCPTWSALTHEIATRFQLTVPPIALTYSDDDGDEITLSSDIELEELWLAALPTVLKLERDSGTKDDAACVKMQIVLPWQEEQAREVKLESVTPAREAISGSVSPLLPRSSPAPSHPSSMAANTFKSASPTTPEQRSRRPEPAKSPDAPFRGVSWQDGQVNKPILKATDITRADPHASTDEHGDQTQSVDAEKAATTASTVPTTAPPPPVPVPNPPNHERGYYSGSSSSDSD
ncbi:hypothetical protein NBRC10513v2_000975 [Rhodotorula toruloides]|uniref:PB1 domain-containing protein n=1 Tax=Rhodotorula toruloides TaxID=5286 RepID=A0A2T0AHH2_RHOTO|nr:hypothetical protein AAT19DRAFT_8514 [Rhodotorula toruloides]